MFGCTTQQPPNEHIQHQRPFYSTKKKQEPSTIKLANPTKEEKEKICEALLANHNMYALFEEKMSNPALKRVLRKF